MIKTDIYISQGIAGHSLGAIFFFESGPVLMHHHNPDKSSSSVSTADNQAELLNKQPDGISHVSHKWVKAIYYNYFN